MSINILPLELPDVTGTVVYHTHVVLSCIVSCVHTYEQDV